MGDAVLILMLAISHFCLFSSSILSRFACNSSVFWADVCMFYHVYVYKILCSFSFYSLPWTACAGFYPNRWWWILSLFWSFIPVCGNRVILFILFESLNMLFIDIIIWIFPHFVFIMWTSMPLVPYDKTQEKGALLFTNLLLETIRHAAPLAITGTTLLIPYHILQIS